MQQLRAQMTQMTTTSETHGIATTHRCLVSHFEAEPAFSLSSKLDKNAITCLTLVLVKCPRSRRHNIREIRRNSHTYKHRRSHDRIIRRSRNADGSSQLIGCQWARDHSHSQT